MPYPAIFFKAKFITSTQICTSINRMSHYSRPFIGARQSHDEQFRFERYQWLEEAGNLALILFLFIFY